MKPTPFNVLARKLNLRHSSQTLVSGVAIDSRKIEPEELFFALPGNRVDGHTFLEAVAAKGAAGAVVHENYRGESFGLPLLRVPDVLFALQDFARKSLEKRSSKVIAITGSLGKTTVKEFAATLLHSRYRIFASPMSYNSQATLPLSILMADETEEYLILEMAMSEKGQIAQLVSIAPPDIALLTTVAAQHVTLFPEGLEGICREKASIFSNPKTKLGLLPRELYNFEEAFRTGSCKKKCFSLSSKEYDYYLELIQNGVLVHAKGEPPIEIPLHLPNKVHYHNFLAAVALAHSLDVSWPLIREAALFIKLPTMRFEKVEKGGIIFINDAFNANPDSMKGALENLPHPRPGGKTIAVVSEMDALGIYTIEGHALVAHTALLHVDLLLCIGKRCETMLQIWEKHGKPAQLFETRSDLEQALLKWAQPGDVVLLKGARSYVLDQILNNF